jgi:hypothetical protein
MPPPLFPLSGDPWTFPPDCGVKCRQPPSLVEAAGPAEFPGRPMLDVAPGDMPDGRFIPPSRCAVFESENRRHPEPSEGAVPTLVPLSACGATEAWLNPPPAGVRTPGEGLAIEEVWPDPLENDCLVPAPLRWMDCRICDTCPSNDCGAAAGRALEKKRGCSPLRGNVDAAAGRLLTDNAERVGTTGRFPAIMRPPRKVSPLTPTGVERPVPN